MSPSLLKVTDLKKAYGAIQAVGGAESHSAEAVRDRIREMIENEAGGDILSDDRIVALLTADGVNIARRTVAKYREAMRIPSSAERRRLGRLGMSRQMPSVLSNAALAAQAMTGPAD